MLDGLAYIEQSKLNAGGLTIGRDVVVIGAGNTAIDCATIAQTARRGAGHDGLSPVRARNDRLPARVRFREEGRRGVSFPYAAGSACETENGRVTGLRCSAHGVGAGRCIRTPDAPAGRGFGVHHCRGSGGEGRRPGEAIAGRVGWASRSSADTFSVNAEFETSMPGVLCGRRLHSRRRTPHPP